MKAVPSLPKVVSRQALRFALLFGFGFAQLAYAQSGGMVGEALLQFAANSLIAPLGIFSIVLALGASVIRPDLVKSAVYTTIICAVLFFVIRSAPQITSALKS